MPLDERKTRILRTIIDDYILTATPIGSRTISQKSGMGLSSATIRNEMSDLEMLGYLDQPHASAGRVPSVQAFRFYVDQIMRIAAIGHEERDYIRQHVSGSTAMMEDVLGQVASVLSDMTSYTAAVLAPVSPQSTFEHVQIVPITSGSALIVVVTSSEVLKDSIVRVPPDVTPQMLSMLSNLLSEKIKGKTLSQLPQVFESLKSDLSAQNRFLFQILASIESNARRAQTSEVVLGGRTNLLKHPEYADPNNLRAVLSALEPHGKLEGLLSRRMGMEFSISIGPELGEREMSESSLVTVSYHTGDGRVGTMGILGPVRMNYARVAALLMHMRSVLEEFNQQ